MKMSVQHVYLNDYASAACFLKFLQKQASMLCQFGSTVLLDVNLHFVLVTACTASACVAFSPLQHMHKTADCNQKYTSSWSSHLTLRLTSRNWMCLWQLSHLTMVF